ncbi:DNA-directed RNA polymerase subunit alpha C-terminal domain-containing protein [Streptosporangium sp. NPDC002524]|uniref:DNA-directed RNA polymerase subunit alpha C-terminal domain-containing protein n=1 Tax=Streptosporangium sp. NPDC002524 TaxID=3154537 RepID=UPI003318078F
MTTAKTTKQVVDQIAAAHKAVKDARDKHAQAAHQRNLAGLVLVRRHKHKPTHVYQSMGVSKTMWDQRIVPRAPVDDKLPKWSEKQARQIIATKVKEILALSADEAEAAKKRIAGVHALSSGKIDKVRWINSQIAASTGLTKTQVGDDLKADPPAEVPHMEARRDEEETTGQWVPLPAMAERLGTPLERLVAALEEARALGESVPASGRGRGRLLVIDAEETTTWWVEGKFGWWTTRDLAVELPGATYDKVRGRLRTAKANGTEPERALVHGVTRYEPDAARTWWADSETNLGRRATEGPDQRGLTITQLADKLTELTHTAVSRDQVKQRLRAARAKDAEPKHTVNEAGHRLYDWTAILKFWQGLTPIAQADPGQEGSDLFLSPRTFNSLTRADIHTMEQLAALTEEQLLDIKNLGPAQIVEIKQALANKGLLLASGG